ncbi:MAG: hypothetical protein QW589_02080 [Candidatus Bathyarchaeia archaeon]
MDSQSSKAEDIYSILAEIVKKSGEVITEYGGYKILVLDPYTFRWSDVIGFLLGKSFDIRIYREDKDKIVILCTQPHE